MSLLAEILLWFLPDFIAGLFFKDDGTKHQEARFDSATGKQIEDD